MSAESPISVTPGQAAYEADRVRRPLYHDNRPRPAWHELGEVAQASWNRNTSAPTLDSETNKDRTGKHGSEVA